MFKTAGGVKKKRKKNVFFCLFFFVFAIFFFMSFLWTNLVLYSNFLMFIYIAIFQCLNIVIV
jgi:hypothetical protein